MKKALWLNSAGNKSAKIIDELRQDYPSIEITSMFIDLGINPKLVLAYNVATINNLPHVVLNYKDTRDSIPGYYMDATKFWGLEYHLRAFHYGLDNTYDTIISGSTNVNSKLKSDDTIENLFEKIQSYLEVPESNKIKIVRPLKHLATIEEIREFWRK